MKTKTNPVAYLLIIGLLLLATVAPSFGNGKGNGFSSGDGTGNGSSEPGDKGNGSGAPDDKGNG